MFVLTSPEAEAPVDGAWKKTPNGQSLLATHYATIFGGKQHTPSVKHYFVSGSGIAYRVIANNIYHYLGNDAIVRSGCQENPLTGQIQQGYVIKSSLNLTAAMISNLKADSVLYKAEIQAQQSRLGRYSFWFELQACPQDLITPENFFWVISDLQFQSSPPWAWPDSWFAPEPERSKKPMSKVSMEFLKTLWGLLEEIIELMQMVRVYTALILETVFSGFSEFPNSMRPPCTTMPWTIWPALVVLWGVCWMFQAAEKATVNLEFQLSSEELQQILFPNSNALIDSPGVPGLSEDLDYLFNSFDGMNGAEFDTMLPYVESYEAPDNISGQTVPSLEEEFPFNFPSSDNLLEPAPSVEIYSVTASSSQISTTPLHGVEGSVIGLTSGVNPQLIETAQSHKAPTTYTRPEKPPLNSNGEMTCNYSDCSDKNLSFTNFGKWSKHQNKHDRPFKCSVASCDRIEGFTSKSDQERHESSFHKALSSEVGTQSSTGLKPPYFCDEPDCTRGPGSNNGFSRKDNLKDHVQRIHGRDLAPSRVSIRGGEGRNGITILANQGSEQHQMGSRAPIPRNQKRTATQATGTSDEETTARKKSRQEDQEANSNMERSPREDALAEQVEKLKKELEEAQKRNEKVQKENEVLISIIDRLTQGPR